MDDKIVQFPRAVSSLREIRGVVTSLTQLKEECLEQGYEFAAFMIDATMRSIQVEMEGERSMCS